MPSLILMFRDRILNAHPLSEGSGLTIGRHQSNDIVIDNLAVSGYHARVDHRPEGFVITDLESKNGTLLNGEQITTTLIANQDSITIGKHNLLVDLTDSVPVDDTMMEINAAGRAPTTLSADETMFLDTSQGRQMRGDERSTADLVHPAADILFFVAGGEGEIDLAGMKTVSIGSNKDADIVVSGLWGLFVGGPAAMINRQTGSYFLRYTGGLIKPKRNGRSVKGTVKLNHDDVVAVGPVKLQIQFSERAAV